MFLTSNQVNALEEADLLEFLGKKIQEGRHLDYKEALSGGSWDKQAREFLKDVTAFANAAGGHLIIGVREPEAGAAPADQVTGLGDGVELAGKLENLCISSIEPRIPGLIIRPVAVNGANTVIIVHVPPSLSRPHMVVLKGHRAFYIRHTETTTPMSTHEIRESVIASMSAETRATQYMKRQESDFINYGIATRGAALMLQAMPLIPLEQDWNVFDEAIIGAVRSGIQHEGGLNAFSSRIAPHPTINGIAGADDRHEPTWEAHIHRNGYIRVGALLDNSDLRENGIKYDYLSPRDCSVIHLFGKYCENILEITQTDLPYLIRMRCFNARGVVFFVRDRYRPTVITDGYPKEVIDWPDHVRQASEPFSVVTDQFCELLYNAFGLQGP